MLKSTFLCASDCMSIEIHAKMQMNEYLQPGNIVNIIKREMDCLLMLTRDVIFIRTISSLQEFPPLFKAPTIYHFIIIQYIIINTIYSVCLELITAFDHHSLRL